MDPFPWMDEKGVQLAAIFKSAPSVSRFYNALFVPPR
jgi:hypothetical protein